MPPSVTIEKYDNYELFLDTEPSAGISGTKCTICKGRLMCGISPCPILSSLVLRRRAQEGVKTSLQGKAFDVSVEWERFPNGHVGPLVLDGGYDQNRCYKNVRERLFYKLSNTYCPQVVGNVQDESMEDIKAIAFSQRAVDVEIEFARPPRDDVVFSSVDRAFCNPGELGKLDVIGEPDIPLFLIEILEKDMKQGPAVLEAYDHGADVDYITKLLSMGCLGKGHRTMPTRWAKTTVYSLCSQRSIRETKCLPVSDAPAVYHQRHLGNDYVVLTLARPWEFELFERWQPNCIWTLGEKEDIYLHEHETYNGVSDQAMREGGSYYAGRLGACELLNREGCQSACLIMLSPSPGTSVPFGSGEIRMGVSGAQLVDRYDSEKDAIDAACSIAGTSSKVINKMSMLLTQYTLGNWL